MEQPSRSSGWWSRSRGLPKPVHASWEAAFAEQPGSPARILAWARAAEGFAVGSPALLSYGDQGAWTHLGWHEIERGGWNAELRTLSWVRVSEPGELVRRGSLALAQPGKLPELFRERVAATIALQQFVPVSGERGITVTARRDLRDGGRVSWHATLTRGLTWNTDGVRSAAEEAVARFRAEYS